MKVDIKLFILTCLIIFSIANCAKDKGKNVTFEGKNDIQQNSGNAISFSSDGNEENLIFEMTSEAKVNLASYFADGNYKILDELLNVNTRKIAFAVHCIKKRLDFENNEILICDTILGFEIVDNSFQRYLLIKDFRFINSDNFVFRDFSNKHPEIYGFSISYSYPTVDGYTPGLTVDTYFDNGDRVADSFTIRWNEEKMSFEDIKPDSPLWFPGLQRSVN